jgi:phage shock protein PspC (stress-responsive transcriptional regulator)
MRHHSQHSNDDHEEAPSKRSGCAIKRIVRGLAHRFDVSRGVVIASFVVGFVFVPVLALLVLGAAWFWVDDPERFEHRVSNAAKSRCRDRHG